MSRALSIIESLHLMSIACVFDQAIHCKACEIKWRELEKFRNCVLTMGMFHLTMTFMAILNKRSSGAGLKDALIQSGVIGEGSVDSVLRGKYYNRGIRMHKLFYESLQRLLFEKLESGTAQLDDYFNDQFQFSKLMFKNFSESERLVKLFQDYLNLKDE